MEKERSVQVESAGPHLHRSGARLVDPRRRSVHLTPHLHSTLLLSLSASNLFGGRGRSPKLFLLRAGPHHTAHSHFYR